MARWGAAMSYSQLLFHQDDVERGRAELALITDVSGLSARERAWIDATRALFAPDDVLSRRRAFIAALEQLHRDYPDDDEAALFLSITLQSDDVDDDRVLAQQARAGSLALEVFGHNPRHPGAAHYIIHAFDTPDLAAIALPAARAYAAIAPAAYHARHMPAHIFGRFGLWEEALASCQSAWDTSVAWVASAGLISDRKDFHSLTWLLSIHFELGHRRDADAVVALFGDELRAGLAGARGFYGEIVSSYLLNTQTWDQLDALLAPLDAPATIDPELPTGDDAIPFALFDRAQLAGLRARAAAERGDVAGVRKHQKEEAAAIAAVTPWFEKFYGKADADKQRAESAPIEKLMAKAQLARAKRDWKALLPLERKLVALLDAKPDPEPPVTGESPREGLADTLMQLGKPKEALAELEAVLVDHPNRARVLLAAARAATKAGDAVAARAHYTTLAEVWKTADADFPGLDEVTKAVAQPAPAPTTTTTPVAPAPAGHHH